MEAYWEKESVWQRAGVLLLGPVTGLAYVVFLPFAVIASVVAVTGGRVLEAALSFMRGLAYFGWRPSETYLSGTRRKKRN